ncbi:HSF1 isoform 7, partial [Pan troglodytes]
IISDITELAPASPVASPGGSIDESPHGRQGPHRHRGPASLPPAHLHP